MPSHQTVQAAEVDYALHTLGWKSFQQLCLTIAADVWGQTVQGFCDANDGGRDGAFYGTWSNLSGQSVAGSFTTQCKFTTKAESLLNLSELGDELSKARRLADLGLADNYFLFSNARLTGRSAEIIQ